MPEDKEELILLIKDQINIIKQSGYSLRSVERALGLPPYTISRWAKGEISGVEIALLRIISTYPWMISVANSDFEPQESDYALLQAANSILEKHTQEE